MSLVKETFVCEAHWPRQDKRDSFERDGRLELVYDVWSSAEESELPAEQRLTLLYVHGAQMGKEVWNYYIEMSFQKWGKHLDKAISMDIAHHGDSALRNAGKTGHFQAWSDMGRDVIAVTRDALKRGQFRGPLILIGHSMGGTACMYAGSFDTALFDAMVVFDPVWGGLRDLDTEVRNNAMGSLSGKIFKYARDKFASQEDYQTYLKKNSMIRKFHPRVLEDWKKATTVVHKDGTLRHKMSREEQAGSYMGVVSINGHGATIIRYMPLPVLVMEGDVVDWNPRGNGELLAKTLPNAQLVQVSGGGHVLMFEQPDKVFDAFASFVTEQYGRALSDRKQWQGKPTSLAEAEEWTVALMKRDQNALDSGKKPHFSKL